MNWGERVLRADPHLTVTARQLIDVISRFFATHAYAYCSFFDSEAAGLIGVSSAQIAAARRELEAKHFLHPLHHPGGKPRPRYALRMGYPMPAEDGEAA
jgi:hypothetical protein